MTTWLIDKSALVRLGASPRARDWATRIERGLIAISTVTRLEVGYSALSAGDFAPRTGPASDRLHACGVSDTSDGGPCTPGSAPARATWPPPRPVDPRPAHRRHRRTERAHRAASGQGLRPHRRTDPATDRATRHLSCPRCQSLTTLLAAEERVRVRLDWRRPVNPMSACPSIVAAARPSGYRSNSSASVSRTSPRTTGPTFPVRS